MVICTTCGQDNPAHLVFCQTCGQRLGPRVAPPTPPVGLTAPTPIAPALSPTAPRAVSPAAGTIAAPVRPAFVAQAPPAPVPVAPASRPNLASTMIDPRPPEMEGAASGVCPVCATANDANLRYCQSCGTTLQKGPTQGPPSRPNAQAATAPTEFAEPPPASAPIQPGRVVELGAPRPVGAEGRTCTRCRAAAEPSAQFCRFCGSPLPAIASPVVPTAPRPPAPPTTVPASPPAVALAVPATPGAPFAPAPAAAPAAAPSAPPPSTPTVPAPPLTPRGRLVIVGKDGGEGPSYPLLDQVDIGRSEGNVIIAEDRYMSPRHARLTRRDGRLFVRDMGSVNGVFLRLSPRRNGAPPSPDTPAEASISLRDQDLFLVGQQVIRFEIVRDAEEGLGPAVEHGTLLFGTPSAPRYARLCQRTIEGVSRDVYYIGKRETVLGRESGDIVFTEDPFLSRRHAAIRFADGEPKSGRADERRYVLADLGSSNGTFLRIRGETPVENGDELRVGQQLFRVDLSKDADGAVEA